MGYFLWFLNESIETTNAANAKANINASYTDMAPPPFSGVSQPPLSTNYLKYIITNIRSILPYKLGKVGGFGY